MSNIMVSITMEAIPEKRRELFLTLRSLSEETRREEGCNSCYLYENVEKANMFVMIEAWEGQEDLERYLKSFMFGALLGVRSLLVRPEDIDVRAVSDRWGMDAVEKARGKHRDP